MKVDIVDDEPILRALYKSVIESSGYEVDCFNDAEDYISYANSDDYMPPSIALVTDICMPGKSGYELIDQIRKSHPNQKVVVITGTPKEFVDTETNACFYLQKPVSPKKLVAVLELLSTCTSTGNTDMSPRCKALNDLDSFNIENWECYLKTKKRPVNKIQTRQI